jgi:hypothetical protein
MSYTVQQHHVLQYGTNVEHLLQQSGMRLAPLCSQGQYTGTSGVMVDQVGQTNAQRNRARHSDTPLISISGDRRWVFPQSYTHAEIIDNLDIMRMLIDLKSPYAQAQAEAMGRAADDEVGAAFFGVSKSGQNGTVDIAFPEAQKVGVNVGGANSGLNVPKLRAARKVLMATGLDMGRHKAYIAISSIEHDNLLGELQVTNSDYNDKKTLVDGIITQFMGFNFVHVEWNAYKDGTPIYPLSQPSILPGGSGSTLRNIPVWVEDGMHYGKWGAMVNRVDPRPDKNYGIQIFSEMYCGAARKEEGKVVQIACNG